MITLYAAHNLPPFLKGVVRDHRVRWALEELTLPYDCRWVNMMAGEHKKNPNRLINPFGKVPALENGALRLFESAAIVLYLYEHAGKAPQDAHARAELNQWCFAAVNTVEPALAEIFRLDVFAKKESGRDERRQQFLQIAVERLSDLEKALGDKPYLLGNAFGPADILMTTAFNFVQHDSAILESHAGIRAYRERCCSRPAYVRALAKHGEGPKANAA